MSYVALITDRFDAMVAFYADALGAVEESGWDRPTGRGRRFGLHGLRIEILDNRRQRVPSALGACDGRTHLVVEVDDIEAARSALKIDTPFPTTTSWGAALFQIGDPDGTAMSFLQWLEPRP